MTERFLSVGEVAEQLGIRNASQRVLNLPKPDALIGRTHGWVPETIDAWEAVAVGRSPDGVN